MKRTLQALEPFADLADGIFGEPEDQEPGITPYRRDEEVWVSQGGKVVTYGDLRRAREVYEEGDIADGFPWSDLICWSALTIILIAAVMS
jgi:hypothetical protein